MSFRRIEGADLTRVVEIHGSAFPGFLMTLLGPAFLRRYYDLVLQYPGGVFLGEFEATQLVGFVAGFVAPSEFYERIRRERLSLALAAGTHLVIRPSLWRSVRESAGLSGAGGSCGGMKSAELASIAVDPAAQGKGVGVRLLQQFISAVEVAGANEVVLTTDAEGNEGVNRMYQSNGFEVFQVSTRRNGRVMNHYRRRI